MAEHSQTTHRIPSLEQRVPIIVRNPQDLVSLVFGANGVVYENPTFGPEVAPDGFPPTVHPKYVPPMNSGYPMRFWPVYVPNEYGAGW
jgi:hypothetical protein